MQKLNLPEYNFRLEKENDKYRIFDRTRKKWVALTPEEWVRQNFIMFMIHEKQYPESLIAVEAALKVAKRSKRTDIVVYDNLLNPRMIVECKAPSVKINSDVFDQIVRYNMTLQVNHLVVTNGLDHYYCKLNYQDNSYHFLKELPAFSDLD